MADYYPPVGFHFRVEFPGIGKEHDISFQEVSGLTAGIDLDQPLAVGGENRFSYRLPKRGTYSNLVLKRGMLSDSGLVKWFKDAIENFEFKPVDVNVHLLNENHEALATWIFMQAYPVKWAFSTFSAKGNEVAIETIELAYQYYRRQTDDLSINISAFAQLNATASISAGVEVSAEVSASIDFSAAISGGIGF
jgi:phage tail-like protein